MHNCDDIREHLESCEDCRLHVVIEARLRTQPVLEPPRGLVARAMKALPRRVPVKREFFRLAAAAAILMGLTVAVFAAKLDQTATALSMKAKTAEAFETTSAVISEWRIDPWKQ
ncbi:MAG TPA: hypothetical protein VE981_12555 [Planctomycetota bacterium]|nr:hypothetical protein [Planctomycetota bacterium]